jgi:hypothetical protein
MPAVVSGPPEWPFLISSRSRERYQEAESSAGSIGAVREEAMKAGGNREHAHYVQGQTDCNRHCAHARPDHQQTGQMHEEKLDADREIQSFRAQRSKVRE